MSPIKRLGKTTKKFSEDDVVPEKQAQIVSKVQADTGPNTTIGDGLKTHASGGRLASKTMDRSKGGCKPPRRRGTSGKIRTIVKKEGPGNESSGILGPVKTLKPPAKRAKTDPPAEFLPVDPVIEQWYTDPYNRHDPEGPTGNEARKHVLTNALRNRGFRGNRIINIVNWLARCNGKYKDYDVMVGSNRRKHGPVIRGQSSKNESTSRTPKGKMRNNRTPSSAVSPLNLNEDRRQGTAIGDHTEYDTLDDDIPIYPSPTSIQASPTSKPFATRLSTILEENSHELDQANIPFLNLEVDSVVDYDDNNDANSTTSSSTILDAEAAFALQTLNQELKTTRSIFQTAHAKDTQAYRDAHDDWLLANLQRTQAFWNIVYGDDLDSKTESEPAKPTDPNGNMPDEEKRQEEKEVGFTYFRDPGALPRVDVHYPSQGLKPVKRVIYQGREVLTEDENFGLCTQ